MRKEIEWINDETLKSHVEKHVKGKNEKAQWESLYLNKYHKNLNDMIANAEDEEIIDIYEMESKQIHKEGDKIYLHIDKKLNKCINVSRYTDNFTTGEFCDYKRNWSIRTCFYKEKIFIDTEILTVIIQLHEALLNDNLSNTDACNTFIKSIDNGVFQHVVNDVFKQHCPKISVIHNIQDLHERNTPEYEKALKFKNKSICMEVFKSFLENQIDYYKEKTKSNTTNSNANKNNTEIYKYVLNNLEKNNPNNKDRKIKEKAQKNLNELIKIYSDFKKLDEFIEYLEMSIIFNLICLHISCSNSNNKQIYNAVYKEIEAKFFNDLDHKTERYNIIKELIVDSI